MRDSTLREFVEAKNNAKKLFTAGPASLALENISGIEPCFGRGDDNYNQVEDRVLSNLKTYRQTNDRYYRTRIR